MKKTILISFIAGIALMFGSFAMAAQLAAPVWDSECSAIDGDYICFGWEDVNDAVKYSVDVEVPVDTDDDGEPDMIVELSFGTSDRTDGGEMGHSYLCVPLTDFVYDLDGDPLTEPDSLSGFDATAKVKALNPGKGKKRQNNPFSIGCDFTLP